jgi:hypothetical protein
LNPIESNCVVGVLRNWRAITGDGNRDKEVR